MTSTKKYYMYIYRLIKKYNITRPLFITYFTFITLIIYFAIKLFFGQKGILQLIELQGQIANQDLSKKELINEIKAKQIRVGGMKSESLDLDLLDEQARKNLGYSSENEVVIYEKNTGKAKKK